MIMMFNENMSLEEWEFEHVPREGTKVWKATFYVGTDPSHEKSTSKFAVDNKNLVIGKEESLLKQYQIKSLLIWRFPAMKTKI